MSKVTEYLEKRHVDFTSIAHEEAATAISEAHVLALPPWMIAKTVVVDVAGEHVIAVVPADRRVDLHRVRALLGDSHAHLADEAEIVKDFPQFDPGAIPPLAPLTGSVTLVDPDIARMESIVFAAGRQNESVRMAVADLLDAPGVRVAPITIEPSWDNDEWLL